MARLNGTQIPAAPRMHARPILTAFLLELGALVFVGALLLLAHAAGLLLFR